MPTPVKTIVDVPTDAGSAGNTLTPPLSGALESIAYQKDATTPYTDGVDFSITVAETGESAWAQNDINASTVRCPRHPVHKVDGTAAVDDGANPALDRIYLAGQSLQIAIASGGANKTGRFIIIVLVEPGMGSTAQRGII